VDGLAGLLMIGLCAVWGAQQVAIKAVINDISPTLQVVIRSGIAAMLVWFAGRLWARERWLEGVWARSGALVGLLFAAEFLFVAEGLRYTTASHMAVFLYTAPLFAAIGLHFRLPEERLITRQWLGIFMAFCGVVITFLAPRAETVATPDVTVGVLGDVFGLCAGAAWGLTTVTVRASKLSEAPAAQTLFYQLAGAFLFLIPVAMSRVSSDLTLTPSILVSLTFQTVIVSFASYLIWFKLLRHYLASQLGVMELLTPLLGVLMGTLWLGEQVSQSFVFGAFLTLAGIALVTLSKGRPNDTSLLKPPRKS
jgi:drug/metabolite transporter (DMT)-like permease